MEVARRLVRPEGLEDNIWGAIEDHENRVNLALTSGDRTLAIGSAKELVESVAKAVLDARGNVVSAGVSFQQVVNCAHGALERQPGGGLTAGETISKVASAAKTMAMQLRAIRNDYGTGHGRSYVPTIGDELLDTTVEAALLWCRWALRRLAFLLMGQPSALATDLRGATFRAGVLTQRLIAADLPRLEREDQHMLGVAVGQRAGSATFVVMDDGVVACAESDDTVRWPVAYREGVVEGLLVGRTGYIDATPDYARRAASVLAPVSESASSVERLVERLQEVPWAPHLRDMLDRTPILEAMSGAGADFRDPSGRHRWNALIDVLSAAG